MSIANSMRPVAQVIDIQLGRMLKNSVRNNLCELGISVTIVDKNVGYELRAADPIPFDVEYTRTWIRAVRYLLKGGSGSMIVFDEGYLRTDTLC